MAGCVRICLIISMFVAFVIIPYLLKETMMITHIYVDNILFGSTSNNTFNEFATTMQKEFEMSMLREVNYILDLQVKQTSNGAFLY